MSRSTEDAGKEKSAVEEVPTNHHGPQPEQQQQHRDGKPRISPKAVQTGKTSGRERAGSSSGKHSKSGNSKVQGDHRLNSGGGKAQSTNNHSDHHQATTAANATPPAVANGDVPRLSSTGKVHVVGGKKQLAVKAVPRNDQQQTPTSIADTVKDKVYRGISFITEYFLNDLKYDLH